MKDLKKIIRITTVPISLKNLLKGQLKFMSQYYNIVGITSPGKTISDIKSDEGIQVIEVEMSRSITPFKDLRSLFKLYEIIKKEQPFIVHSHTPKAGTLGMLASKLAGVPHRLHTVAGLPLLETTGVKRMILDIVEKITYACATKIYPNSFGLKEIIIVNKYTKKEKLKVIGNGSSNGIDVDYFSAENLKPEALINLKNELKISKEDIVFIYVGRLVTDKGLNELVSAFKRINISNVKLLLVGTYEHKLDSLKITTLDEIKDNENIIFIGWQIDVRPYMTISNVLVFPSYREGFPNVVMQAGALNLPSIVTNINGCNEIICHDYNGLIIPVKDEEKLYIAMMELINNPKKRNLMAKASRKMICDNYRHDVIWDALLKEYKNLETL